MRLLQLDTDGLNYLKQKLWIQGILVHAAPRSPCSCSPVAFLNYLQLVSLTF